VPTRVSLRRVVINMGVAPASSANRTNSSPPGTAPDLEFVCTKPFQEVCLVKIVAGGRSAKAA